MKSVLSEEDGAEDVEDEESKPDLKRLKIATFDGHFESASSNGLQSSSKNEHEASEIIYFGAIECRYTEIRFEQTETLIRLSQVETTNCSLLLEVPCTQMDRMNIVSNFPEFLSFLPKFLTIQPPLHFLRTIYGLLLEVDPSLFEYIGSHPKEESYIAIKLNSRLNPGTTFLQLNNVRSITLDRLRKRLSQVNTERKRCFGKPFLSDVMPPVEKEYEETLMAIESNLVYFGLVECYYQEIKFKKTKLVILLSRIESVDCIRTLNISHKAMKSIEFVSDYSAFTVSVHEKFMDKSLRKLIEIDPSVKRQPPSYPLSKITIKTNYPIDGAAFKEITRKVPQFPKKHTSVTNSSRFKMVVSDLSDQRIKYFKKPMQL